MPTESTFHHLRHRYFECNYGNRPVPIDRLFGTFHDGTPEAHARMRQRMKARRGTRAQRPDPPAPDWNWQQNARYAGITLPILGRRARRLRGPQ